jgi:hypothetical protein
MTKTAMLVASAALFVAASARAAGDHEMLAAEQELKIAKDHLQAAGPEYEGHRRAAMKLIDEALREVRQGLQVSRGRGERPAAGREHKGRRQPETEAPSDDD